LPGYAYIYNVAAQTVAIEANVTFDTNGILSGGITHTAGTEDITLGTAGTYAIWFYVLGAELNQFTLYRNNALVPGAIYASAVVYAPNIGMVIITAAAGDVLTVKNHTSPSTVTLEATTAGTAANANASILIEKLTP
jgi:hypothetical protein